MVLEWESSTLSQKAELINRLHRWLPDLVYIHGMHLPLRGTVLKLVTYGEAIARRGVPPPLGVLWLA